MSNTNQHSVRTGHVESLNGGRWQRVLGNDPELLTRIREDYGADLHGAASSPFSENGDYIVLAVSYVDRTTAAFTETSIVLAVGPDRIITLEPFDGCAPLDLALSRMERDGRENDSPIEIAASVIESVADTTDQLVGSLNDGTEHMMAQSNAILRSLETKKARDFGVSDVTDTQQELADMEELLSYCMESQLVLAESARHLRGLTGDRDWDNRTDLDRLIEDVEAIEPHIEFVHDRVRLLQQTNNLALNVKQNQIIKVFSVVTAVFLPVMLLSTYYSMNFEFMPILGWQYAEPAIIVLSFFFAMLPLLYVRRRGWLR
ncbi:CorA family divalent cation transporter [Leucobacter luti]|uniref:Magnesium transporter n=1 Tax=Leucobacter luti TaxID=340320 RepID=A0A4Q7TM59_9MICO|nr:CorA family divalent cation transporter [Leucobacter luti]MBL3700200.1 magnesium transporter [Leucobacter luti]RZT61077.1 magnesium transporter [Leucobacter luti]